MPAIQDVFQMIDAALKEDPSRAQGVEAVYQFNLSGEEAGTYQIILRPDHASAVEGEQETPDCTLSIDSEDFKKMVEGELNGTQAFMSGQLKIDGDMGLAIRLQDVLAAYSAAQ
ncbi:MAG TPA: SCP2 sterol-binding domain-containing protein [Bacillales bacterium]|nr:SCP2 sterol-binding domain-containing protein [Bacillales bacterium]